MKNKIASLIFFILLAYVIPLAGRVDLLVSIQVGLLVIIAGVIMTTQPPISINEAKREKGKDKFLVGVILMACVFSQVFSIVEWAYFKDHHAFFLDFFTALGRNRKLKPH